MNNHNSKLFMAGDSNTAILRNYALDHDIRKNIIGISGANLIKNGSGFTEKLFPHIPEQNLNMVLWFGNEVDSKAQTLKHSHILLGCDYLANKFYNGLLSKQKIKQNDPLKILTLYKGKLLEECETMAVDYVNCLRKLSHVVQCKTKIS